MAKCFPLVSFITCCSASIISSNCLANSSPFNLEITYDSSVIKNNGSYQQINRSLTTVGYQQNFSLWGGEISPQLSFSIFRGKNGTDTVQDIQGFSNIDAKKFSRWQEVNVQWHNDDTLIRLGQLDANANFATLEYAEPFVNSSFGLTPTAFPLPTYPDMEYGLYLDQKIYTNMNISLGYYLPDEVDDTGKKQPLLMLSMCWFCNDNITVNTGFWRVKHNNIDTHGGVFRGAFAYVEGNISTQLNGFLLYSYNDVSQQDQIKKHVKTGLTYDAPFGFSEQQVGVAYSKIYGPDNESAIELYYMFPINEHISLQPDIQRISNSLNSPISSIVSTLRIQVSW